MGMVDKWTGSARRAAVATAHIIKGLESARQFKSLLVSVCVCALLDQFDRGGEIHQECKLEFQTEYERESQLE